MEDQKEIIGSLLDDLASQVMVLEPGDLMSYGEVLSRLEQLTIIAEGADLPHLPQLSAELKSLLERMILGDEPDQEQGLEVITEGVSLGQAILRGEAAEAAVSGFLSSSGLIGGEAPAEPEEAPAPAEPEPPAEPEAAEEPEEPEAAEEPEPAPAEEAEPAPAPAAEAAPPQEAVATRELALVPAGQQDVAGEDADLLGGFVTEAIEHLESIEVNTLVLEDTPTDLEALNAVFRPFHTIKGVSGFLNLGDINHLAHALENLLDQARSGSLVIDGFAIDVILTGVDWLKQMILETQDAVAGDRARTTYDTSSLEARIEGVISGAIEEKAQARADQPKLGEILVEAKKVSPEAVNRALAVQKDGKSRPVGEILVSQGAAEPQQVADGLKAQKAMGRGQVAQEVKIDTQKLDFLLDMVGELVIAQSMVRANPNVQAIEDRKLMADMAQLSRITSDLQKTTMAMRMVPIKQTFQKMSRVVRDTAKKKGKDVRLDLEGEGTEIDRNMVEKFYDPLMHMVRNSVDHGCETPEEREAAGKPPQGVVVLAAYHKGGSVCIEIRDDGRGLDRDKIVAKAIERELIDNDEGMSDEDVYHLIMQAGFSTAEEITEISGRGVGMDVVQRTIEELRGKVEISSTKGVGTTFIIALPLTLAIIDGMVVEVGSDRYILPTISVAESLRPKQSDYSTVQGKGEMIMIRGGLLPLIRLHQLVEVEPEHQEPWEGLVVVVEHHGQKRCLMVDRLIGRQEVVIKSLGESLKDVKLLAGGAIMGDGRVGLILDVEGLLKAHEGR